MDNFNFTGPATKQEAVERITNILKNLYYSGIPKNDFTAANLKSAYKIVTARIQNQSILVTDRTLENSIVTERNPFENASQMKSQREVEE